MQYHRRQGFTLIEIAIVIVIISLIVAGVLLGRDMIRAAEFRKIQKQYEEISSGVHAFRDKYHCWPGDCPNATTLFGAASDCPDRSGATLGTPATLTNDTIRLITCNGDDDGRIDANNTLYETTTFWQHLGAAELIGGSFTGGFMSASPTLRSLYNVPPVAAFSSQQFYWVAVDGDNSVWVNSIDATVTAALTSEHVGTILMVRGNAGTADVQYPMSPHEQQSYENKFDDGSPVKGRVRQMRSFGGTAPHCTDAPDETATDAANVNAQYLANDATYKNVPACAPTYINVW